MKKVAFIMFLLASFVVLISLSAMAQEGGKIRFGKLKVIPGITAQAIYDDNIYLGNGTNNTDEIEESDWVNHLMPSLILDYALNERGSVRLGYQGDFAYYGETEQNNWQTDKGLFNLDYKAPGGVIIGINNLYTDAEDPYGSSTEYGLGQLTERWNNDLKTKLGYNFGNRLKAFLFYNFYKQDYDLETDYTQDYDVNEFGTGFELKLLPKTWGFIRYHYGEQDYFTHPAGTGVNESNDADLDWHRVNMGLTWDSGAKLSGELNFGYIWRDHDNLRDPNDDLYDSKDSWIAATSVIYTATSTTTLSLSITRALSVTGSNNEEFMENTSIGLTLQQRLLAKLTLTAGGTYGYNDYNLPADRNREDDNYSANIGLDYMIQEWLKAGVGYTYGRKDSNYIANDYTDNQFMILVSAAY